MVSQVEVSEGRIVEAIWSRLGDVFVYEGCPLLLMDGDICALSVSRRVTMSVVPKGKGFPCMGS